MCSAKNFLPFRGTYKYEDEFLDIIATKDLKVFLLAINSHL
jgi:hypothetical protein